MKASKENKEKKRTANRVTVKSGNGRRQLLPALIAVGGACGMMAGPASALELGELKINSALGQPLRASIAYALNPHEELYDFCVYLRPSLAANGLPVLSRASVSIADGAILLTGSRAIREPLLTMQVSIDCPYTAHISREYTLMINPPTPVIREGPIVVEPPAATESRAATAAAQAPRPRPPVEPRVNLELSPISENSRYLVQRGDSLSDIASRISNRSIALWPAVDHIFAVNPNAFMDGDMNRLKAGSWLDIPDLSIAVPEPTIAETVSMVASAPASEARDFTAYTGYEAPAVAEEPPVIEDEAPAPAVTQAFETEEPLVSEFDASETDFDTLQPGDVVVGDDMSFVSPIGTEADGAAWIDIPDTEIDEPAAQQVPIVEPAIQPVPVVSTGQGNETAGKTSGSWSWFVWLGGTGLALILGLLLFGQRFRDRFGSVAVGVASEPLPNRRETDAGAQVAEAVEDDDLEVPDASLHSASLTLDADFGDGSGLRDTADMDVAQDFGFSASTTFEEELDMEIPEGADAEESPEPTEMIPTIQHANSILESEVLPSEDDDYDMSMIVDVTKQDVVESDATEKDLQAVQIETASESKPDDLTLTQDTDYKILEQDYEDEFSATQILNAEIEKAAAELADRMDIDATGEVIARLPENMDAVNDDINDSSVNAEVTAELPAADDEVTAEMTVSDDDVTVGLEIESSEVDTKRKKKAS